MRIGNLGAVGVRNDIRFRSFRVHVRGIKPVNVSASSDAHAIDTALDKLRRAHRDRARDSWKIDRVEAL